jgi:hypothetical protein
MMLPPHTTTLLLALGLVSGSLAFPILAQPPAEVQTNAISTSVWCQVPGVACTSRRTTAIKRVDPTIHIASLSESAIDHESSHRRNDKHEDDGNSELPSTWAEFLNWRAPSSEPGPLKLKISFCGTPGMGCNYRKLKRSGELDEVPSLPEHLKPRETLLNLLKISLCGLPGMGCAWKRAV